MDGTIETDIFRTIKNKIDAFARLSIVVIVNDFLKTRSGDIKRYLSEGISNDRTICGMTTRRNPVVATVNRL